MTDQIVTSSGTGYYSLSGDSGAVGYLSSEAVLYRNGAIFYGYGASQRLMIEGRVESYGAGGNTVSMQGADALVTVGTQGSILNLARSESAAVNLGGDGAILHNDGRISGGMGVFVSGTGVTTLDNGGNISAIGASASYQQVSAAINIYGSAEKDVDISNSGLLKGGLIRNVSSDYNLHRIAVFVGNSSADSNISLDNSGRIVGEVVLGLGNDSVLNTGRISSSLTTGAGNDRVVNTGKIGDFASLGEGNDTFRGGGGTLGSGVYGGDGNDSIISGLGDDVVYGGDGNDTLLGGAGDDFIADGAGNDMVRGGLGDDNLNAGEGRDTLFGGGGADSFTFLTVNSISSGADRDQVRDFTVGEDVINLSAIDANTNAGGNQTFSFIGAAAFSGVAGQLRYAGGIVSGDVNGDGNADFALQIFRAPSLTASDFYL